MPVMFPTAGKGCTCGGVRLSSRGRCPWRESPRDLVGLGVSGQGEGYVVPGRLGEEGVGGKEEEETGLIGVCGGGGLKGMRRYDWIY